MSIGSAESKVTEIQRTAISYQSDIYSAVQSGLASLLSGAVIDAPSVSEPSAPGTASLPSMPASPSIPTADVTAPTAPTAPALETASVSDVDVPVFNATAPSIVLPTFDDIAFPDAPGDAPTFADIGIPAAPDVTLPDVPALADIDIPEAPSIITPTFEGTSPVLPVMDTPGQVFSYQEGAFASPLWDAVSAQLVDDVLNGGDVSAILDTAGVFEQQSRWVVEERERRKEEIRATYSAMGYSRLPGPALAQIRVVELDAEKSLEGLLNTITAKKAELTIQNRQFAIQQSLAAVTGVALEVWNQSNNRALESAKAAVAAAYQDVDARVALHNLQVSAFQAHAAVFQAKIQAALADLEAYKTTMEGARIRGELRKQDVDLYLARLQGVTQVIEVYKARMAAASIQADTQKSTIAAYESRVQAFATEVNAVTAQYNARVAQISGEKAKAEVFATQAQAYATQVGAVKTIADIDVARAGIVTQRNQSNVQLFGANVDAYKAVWTGRLGAAEVVARNAANIVARYDAEVRGSTAENDARIRNALAAIQIWSSRLDASLKEAGMQLQWGQTKAEINERAAATAAQVAGQAFASVMSTIHGSVNLGASYSDAVSDSKSTSTSTVTSESTSTSHSTGYSENYNYNKSLSA